MNLVLIKKWITRWESTRFAAYDDKTGKQARLAETLMGMGGKKKRRSLYDKKD